MPHAEPVRSETLRWLRAELFFIRSFLTPDSPSRTSVHKTQDCPLLVTPPDANSSTWLGKLATGTRAHPRLVPALAVGSYLPLMGPIEQWALSIPVDRAADLEQQIINGNQLLHRELMARLPGDGRLNGVCVGIIRALVAKYVAHL